jgi:hypothetical protein
MPHSENEMYRIRSMAAVCEEIEKYPDIPSVAFLRPFCSNDEKDWPRTAPFTHAGYTWAMNRNIFIRVPSIAGVPVYDSHENPYLDAIIKSRMPNILRFWSHAFREVAMRPARLPIDGIHLPHESVPLLNSLPGLMIETEPGDHYLSFRFDGGEGIANRLSRPEPRLRPGVLDEERPF